MAVSPFAGSVMIGPGSRPSPASRPLSKAGMRNAWYAVAGASLRGQSSRDETRSGFAASVAAMAAVIVAVSVETTAGASSPLTCTCAQAHSVGGRRCDIREVDEQLDRCERLPGGQAELGEFVLRRGRQASAMAAAARPSGAAGV